MGEQTSDKPPSVDRDFVRATQFGQVSRNSLRGCCEGGKFPYATFSSIQLLVLRRWMMAKEYVVVDTDCGSDDAMALMLALGGERAGRILAVTCCFGNTTVGEVRRNVLRVLQACGRTEIPVYQGSGCPLFRSSPDPLTVSSSSSVHGADGFGNSGHLFPLTPNVLESLQQEPAASALVRMTRERPGEITLVAVAPLTNVAVAHRLDTDLTTRLKRIVCLGGNYRGVGNVTETAEFNFFSDPESAHIVLTESRCPIQLVPWETCLEHGMDWDDFHGLLMTQNAKADLLRNATSVVSKFCLDEGDSTFLDCDVLAMAAALWPECVAATMETCMAVECVGQYTRGMCVCLKGKIPTGEERAVEIVQRFDKARLRALRKDMVAEPDPAPGSRTKQQNPDGV